MTGDYRHSFPEKSVVTEKLRIMILASRSHRLDLHEDIGMVGILNVTPDAYVDGGKYTDPLSALARAKCMAKEGAHIIEIGGESTGPSAQPVDSEQEWRRIEPILSVLREQMPQSFISIDTWKADIADRALHAGADMINDVLAGRGDAHMFSVIAKHACPYVMMYAKDASVPTTKEERRYDDVMADICAFLAKQKAEAVKAGVQEEMIIIDPGLGHFISAIPQYSFAILANLQQCAALAPVLVSPSRKSFLAGKRNMAVGDRLSATLAATTVAVLHGASFIRTHDVAQTRAAIEIAQEIKKCMSVTPSS